jgi:hypothetical protein
MRLRLKVGQAIALPLIIFFIIFVFTQNLKLFLKLQLAIVAALPRLIPRLDVFHSRSVFYFRPKQIDAIKIAEKTNQKIKPVVLRGCEVFDKIKSNRGNAT